MREDPDRIGADAEVGRVAEGHHAAVAEDQVEADRGDGEDHHAAQQVEVKRLLEERSCRRHRSESQQQRDQHMVPRDQVEPLEGNNPSGRKASTPAINR